MHMDRFLSIFGCINVCMNIEMHIDILQDLVMNKEKNNIEEYISYVKIDPR